MFAHWRAWKVDGYLVDAATRRRRLPVEAPWPHPGTRFRDEQTDGWFRFLVSTPAARSWIPTTAQYDAAAAELDTYAAELRDGRVPVHAGEPGAEWVENAHRARRPGRR